MMGNTIPSPDCVPDRDGTHVTYQGRRLLGPSPRSSQERRLPTPPAEQTMYLCLSPLLGEGLARFLSHLPPSSTVLCLEFEAPLQELWHSTGVAPRHPAMEYTTTLTRAVFLAEQMIRRNAIRRVETIQLSGGARFHSETYAVVEREIQDRLHQYWKNRGTEIRLGRRWISNLWRNLLIERNRWENLSIGTPRKAIIVGAGPSLDYNLSFLSDLVLPASALHPRPVIIALDTALPSLAERDIPVDFVVSMDGQLANAADFVPFRWDTAKLIADVTVHPSIPRMFSPANRFFFLTSFTHRVPLHPHSTLRWSASDPYDGIPVLTPRGSVAPTAIEVAIRFLGLTDIITVGVDFYYRPPRSHASLSTGHRRFLRTHTRLRGSGGPAAVTNRPWRSGTLVDGSGATVDSILADQAKQSAFLIKQLGQRLPLRIQSLPGQRLDIGTEEITTDEYLTWLKEIYRDPKQGAPIPTSSDQTIEPTRNLEVLERLRDQLTEQEGVLSTRDQIFLDAELDWVWIDLPQWPLAARKTDWVGTHRERLLRGIRDHRRRLDRALLFGRSLENR